MAYKVKVTTVGNSTGIVLPKELLERLRISRGDELHVRETPDGIILSPYDEEFARQLEVAETIMREDRDLLHRLHMALRNPRWMLYLGRRAFTPGAPIWLPDGLQEMGLLAALQTYPWVGSNLQEYARLERVRVVLEDPDGNEVRPDQPISFAERRFAPRRVRSEIIPVPPLPMIEQEDQ